MTPDKLSKLDDRAILRAYKSGILTQFPNPKRQNCPGRDTLRMIATKRISMRDPAIDHVSQCSPCFAELTEIRQLLRRQKLLWASGAAVAAIVLAAVLAGLF
jgi:hypothetical protein